MNYNVGLQCYIMWVKRQCAPIVLSLMFLVLASLYIVWPTIFTIIYIVGSWTSTYGGPTKVEFEKVTTQGLQAFFNILSLSDTYI